MNITHRVLFTATSFMSFLNFSHADVLSWRDGGNGIYDSSTLPKQLDQHILWETSLEESSNASPIIVGNLLFICEEPNRKGSLLN